MAFLVINTYKIEEGKCEKRQQTDQRVRSSHKPTMRRFCIRWRALTTPNEKSVLVFHMTDTLIDAFYMARLRLELIMETGRLSS